MASPSITKAAIRRSGGEGELDWRRIAYHTLVSRALDDVEEETNRNKAKVPKEHLVLYQFSARGHDVPQTILGEMLTHPRDGISAYYRSRPLQPRHRSRHRSPASPFREWL